MLPVFKWVDRVLMFILERRKCRYAALKIDGGYGTNLDRASPDRER